MDEKESEVGEGERLSRGGVKKHAEEGDNGSDAALDDGGGGEFDEVAEEAQLCEAAHEAHAQGE